MRLSGKIYHYIVGVLPNCYDLGLPQLKYFGIFEPKKVMFWKRISHKFELGLFLNKTKANEAEWENDHYCWSAAKLLW